ncbi:MAG: 2-C-methyl-D-erythritol 4-phosphate cytidylyltransferase [Arenimonas sp. SCN 70-307]|uniref:2-C-methyl-D-erythritol 4-phosphate cytidylyltransferase n=1 Tax=Arenimonas sp. SCN 70-307 TaxID=1660089 RepID=UPI00086D9B08|nr:2-C-methyl-D-erythritol 4-phosphate cytidylyltransferase [Arenimonas sp. SCN 70-307]ODS62800.1 MAG: 2-C-methyl-D-erythritol 4-phosphate cytidylyltransferase [Arenimonas sp. SCN 70-307]
MTWAVVAAAGRGTRFGAPLPKQYLPLAGRRVIEHSLRAVLDHPDVDGVVVALAAGDADWPGWRELGGKPVLTCTGGAERADSVLAALHALPASVSEDQWVLVHDAARPCLHRDDLARLLFEGGADPVGALLAAPVRDTLKRADEQGRAAATEPRERLWRALTPQLFRRGSLVRALEAAVRAGVRVTDEAMAIERLGLKPRLVEGRDDNLKITTPADLALAEFILSRRQAND